MRAPGLVQVAVIVACLTLVPTGPRAQDGTTRHYYIAAEDGVWDFAPGGRNQMHGGAIPRPWTRATRWTKARYVEYTDETFTTKKPQPSWLGILGPIIRAEVGDTLVVHFWNRTRLPRSVHPHGVRHTKDHEGALYHASGAGARVLPGRRYSYTWTADEGSGPRPADPSSIVWWYHSHVDEPADVNAGLLGPLVITARGKARPDGTPVDVDREVVAMLMIFDEAKGEERGLMHAINGFVFGNLPGLVLNRGERVRWYLLGMGNERDLHTLHWHAKTLRYIGRNTDVIELLPGSMATADMVADNPGTWLMHCHVADHLTAGMFATYTITP